MPAVGERAPHRVVGFLERDSDLRPPKPGRILGEGDERSVGPLGDGGQPSVVVDGLPDNQSS